MGLKALWKDLSFPLWVNVTESHLHKKTGHRWQVTATNTMPTQVATH